MSNEWIVDYKRLKQQADEVNGRLRDFLTPQLTNLDEVAGICQRVMNSEGYLSHPRDLATAVVLRLFCPVSLLSSRRVKGGVTMALSRALKTNYTYQSTLVGAVRSRYQHIRVFREEVEQLVVSSE